jgi:hypothetical protein
MVGHTDLHTPNEYEQVCVWRYTVYIYTYIHSYMYILSRVRGSVTSNNGLWIGFIDNFFYNLSESQSIIALPLIYPIDKS